VSTVSRLDRIQRVSVRDLFAPAPRVTERFRRRDFGHLDVQITVDDPKTFTNPFTITVTELLVPDTELLESFCAENDKDVAHISN